MSNKNFALDLIIDTDVKNLADLNQMIDGLEQAGHNVDFLRLRSSVLADEWNRLDPREQAKRLRRLKEAAVNAAKGTEKLSESTNRNSKSIKKAGKNVEELTQKTRQLDKVSAGLNRRLKQIGAGLATYFSIKTVAGFFQSAISGAANLEEQLDKIQAVSGATNDQMAKITDTAKELGSTTRYTATEAAQGFEILARAGLNAEQQITTILSVLALAQGQSIGMAESAQFVGDAISIMGGSFDEAGRYADVLAKGASQANTTVPQLANAIGYAGQYAKDAGLDIENLTGVLDVLAQSGIRGERAGTALRNIFAQLQDPASNAAKELDKLGIKTDDLAGVIDGLKVAGDGGKAAINAFGTEAGPALRTLIAGGSAAIDEYTQKLRNAGGAAQAAAAQMDDNLKGAFRGLGSAWDSLKNALGEPILEPIKNQVNRLAGVIRDFVASGEVQKLGDYFARVFGDMAKTVVDFVQNFTLDDTTQKVSAFADEITAKFDRVGAAFGLVYNTLATGFNTIRGTISGVASVVTGAVAEMSQGMADFVAKIPGMGEAAEALQTHAGAMKAVAQAYKDDAKQAFDAAGEAANRVQENVKTLTQSTQESTIAARDNASAVSEEVAAFNAKAAKLAELKQKEAEYAASGKKHTQEYNDVVTERINLEGEIAEAVKGKVLLAKEETEATKQATDAVKKKTATDKDADSTKAQSTEIDKKSTKTTKEKTEATKAETAAQKENTEATKENAEATEGASSIAEAIAAINQANRDALSESATALEHYNRVMDAHKGLLTTIPAALDYMSDAYQGGQKILEQYREHVGLVDEAIERLNGDLTETGLTMKDVNDAALLAKTGVEELDEARLNKLNESIEKARQRLVDLKQQAQDTAAELEAELASLKGDDSLARELEQKKKLAELEKKLAAARARNSAEEIAAYEKAIQYQKQIFEAEQKKYEAEKQRENERKRNQNSGGSKGGGSSSSGSGGSISSDNIGKDIGDAVTKMPLPHIRIDSAKIGQTLVEVITARDKQIAKQVEDNLTKQIRQTMKGRGR